MALINGLVSYWKLDDDAPNTDVEDIHSDNEGTIIGGETSEDMSVEGKINTALYFDGNDYITVDDDPSLTLSKNMSVSIWIKPDLGDVNSYMNKGVFNQDGYLLQFNAIGELEFYTSQSGAWQRTKTYSTLTDGAWNHVVISCDNGACSIYINNTESTYEIKDTHIDPADGATTLLIGARAGPIQQTHGALDEIGIWNRTLTVEDIDDLWNDGNGLAYPFVPVTNMKINIGDTLKDVDSIKINIGGVLKDVIQVKQNIGGVLKDVFG